MENFCPRGQREYLLESNYVWMLQRSVVHNLPLNMLINLENEELSVRSAEKPNNVMTRTERQIFMEHRYYIQL
jgi:hypothetical protein